MERTVLAFGAGAACASMLVFALCVLGLAATPWLLAAVLASLAVVGFVPSGRAERLNRRWLALFCFAAIPFALLYLVNAAAPEISPDGSAYHLGLVRRYLNHGGFYRITTSMYANLTQGCEMLFLVAFAVGRHSAAALVHFLFLLALPAALIAYGRRFRMQKPCLIAALFVFVAPVVGIDGTSAYVDVALAFIGFVLFYWLEIWDETRSLRPLMFAGLMAGFCFAIKYTGFVAGVYALGYVVLRTRDWKAIAAVAAPAALIVAPWLIKNWIEVQDPVSPFLTRLFPNPYIHIAFEDEYRWSMRHFNGASVGWSTPLDLTVRGGALQGMLGPAFLLAPLGLTAATESRGRRILAAAAMFGLPWFSNIGTRFLIPALPFIALALGITLSRWPRVAAALAVMNAALCWPDVLKRYCDPDAWRLTRFPLKAALRITPEQEFLDRNAPEIRYARLIQDRVPATGVVYTAQPIMEAYTDRTILLNYTSALNNRIEETLNSVVKPKLQPSLRMVFRFESQNIRGFRLTAANEASDWAIHEFDDPQPARIVTRLNAWEESRAGDGQEATAWHAWQPVRRGDFIQCELAETIRRDSVSMRTRANGTVPVRLSLETAAGRWVDTNATPGLENVPTSPARLRAEAIDDARKAGVTHVLIHDEEPLGPDFRAHAEQWQVRLAGEAPPVRLYELLPMKIIDTLRETRNNTR